MKYLFDPKELTADAPLRIVNAKNETFFAVVEQDTCPESPRTASDGNLGTMVCWHKRYNFGDEHQWENSSHFINEMTKKFCDLTKEMVQDMSIAEELQMLKKSDDVLLIPLYLYEHSGIAMSTYKFYDRWDSCQVGWIYATKEKAFELWRAQPENWKERAEQEMTEEVNVYSEYLEGNVYEASVYKVRDVNNDALIQCCVRNQDWDPDCFQSECSCGYYGSNHESSGLADFVQSVVA